VEGWGKIVAGVVIGVAGTVYATNEELRKQLPKTARDLPDNVRRRFDSAVSAAREASSRRREEILRDLERHDAAHRAARLAPAEEPGVEAAAAEPIPTTNVRQEATQSAEEESP
jgi:uncharacterized membrane protein YccC